MARLSGDWPYWVVGLALAAGGVLLMYRSILADRAHGRSRCPKCWYEMSGATGLLCPECGGVALSERALLRTRRRWRRAGLAFAIILAGAATTQARSYQRWFPYSIVPSWLLVRIAPADFQPPY